MANCGGLAKVLHQQSRPSHCAAGRSLASRPSVGRQRHYVLSAAAIDAAPRSTSAASAEEAIRSLDGWAQHNLLPYLKPSQSCWQPSDFLPNPADPYFTDQVQELRDAAANLPYDYLVVLVGDMVTEEALPSYMNMLNRTDGIRDETGCDGSAWARWTRAWTAEENRHGDLLNKYLYLCGRVDMRSVEETVQRLVGSGFDPQFQHSPYLCFIYTSFQERATKMSHGSTARLANMYGDHLLAQICGTIAADEGRHEAAYQLVVQQLLKVDPDNVMLALAHTLKKGVAMPAHLLDDGWHGPNNGGANMFVDYATLADTLGVYTTRDYADIVDHLVNKWKIPSINVTSGEAAAAQEFIMKSADRTRRLADLQFERRLRERRLGRQKLAFFSWVGKRQVALT